MAAIVVSLANPVQARKARDIITGVMVVVGLILCVTGTALYTWWILWIGVSILWVGAGWVTFVRYEKRGTQSDA